MQTLEDYAHKSGLELKKDGPCQLCGSRVTGGIYECFEMFQQIVGEASNPNDTRVTVQLIIVDAHALQHSEVHGIRNNNYHLLRLLGIYKYGTSSRIGADYSFLSPILDPNISVLHLDSPQVKSRGILTVADIVGVNEGDHSIKLIKDWGREVFNAWGAYKSWAEEEWSRLRV